MIYCKNCRKSKLSVDVRARHNGSNMCEPCFNKWAVSAGKKVKSKEAKDSTASVPYTEMIFGDERTEHRFILNRLDFLSMANGERILTPSEIIELDVLQRRRREIENPVPAPEVTFSYSIESNNTVWASSSGSSSSVEVSSGTAPTPNRGRVWRFRPYHEASFDNPQEEYDFIVGRMDELMDAQGDGYSMSNAEFSEFEVIEARRAELEDEGYEPSRQQRRRTAPIPVARFVEVDEAPIGDTVTNSDDFEEMLNDLNEDED